jgi:hypothetical protein
MPPSRTPQAEPTVPRGITGAETMPTAPPVVPPAPIDGGADPVPRSAPRSRVAWQKWSRLVHVYSSMAALLVVLFFGATGITLNHPEWTLGFETSTAHVTGTLPSGSVTAGGEPQFLVISERIRQDQNVRGTVTDFGRTPTGGFISYRGPGYAADATFDTVTNTYQATVEQQGLVGIANDLHKGRNAASSWGWLIDLSGIFLVVIAVTGLTLQLVLRRRRRSAIIVAAAVAVVCSIWAVVAIH